MDWERKEEYMFILNLKARASGLRRTLGGVE